MASIRIFPYSVIRETKEILKTKHKHTRVAENFEKVLFSFDIDINYKKYSVGIRKFTSDDALHCEIDRKSSDIFDCMKLIVEVRKSNSNDAFHCEIDNFFFLIFLNLINILNSLL